MFASATAARARPLPAGMAPASVAIADRAQKSNPLALPAQMLTVEGHLYGFVGNAIATRFKTRNKVVVRVWPEGGHR